MATIIWTEQARQCVSDIFDYIAKDSPAAAQKVVVGIYDKAQMLIRFPEIGFKYRDEPNGEIRILLYGNYVIAYLLRTTGAVEVLGVFHGAMEFDKFLP